MSSAGMSRSYFGSMAGSPASFTSPGQDPQALAALMAMLQRAGQSGQQPGAPGAPGGAPMGTPPGMPPGPSALPPGATVAPGATPPPGNLTAQAQTANPSSGASPQLQNLMSMDPAMLKALLMKLGVGASSAMAGTPVQPMLQGRQPL